MGLHPLRKTAAVHLTPRDTARDLNHDLALPGTQRREALAENDKSLLTIPQSEIAVKNINMQADASRHNQFWLAQLSSRQKGSSD
jgi:hypothetical protein